LKEVSLLLNGAGYDVNNVDSIVVAQSPRLSPYLAAMRQNIAAALNVEESLISVKATTTEKLGFVGQQEGMAAYAVTTIRAK
jgi:2-C-methyl-D-erythritol 2,4-cyclodiphosphate synthase